MNDHADCTSGFVIKRNSKERIITAGHCSGGPGAKGSIFTNLTRAMHVGTVTENHLKPDWYDIEEYARPGDEAFRAEPYRGAHGLVHITGTRDLPEEQLVTTAGFEAGEVRKQEILKSNGECYDSEHERFQTCFLDIIHSKDKSCGVGNSGGPIYQYYPTPSDDKANAIGMIVGSDKENRYCFYHAFDAPWGLLRRRDSPLLGTQVVFSGDPQPDVQFGQVRADYGFLFSVDSTNAVNPLGPATWDTCSVDYRFVGHDFNHDGFWLCARTDLAARSFYVGNVVNGVGYYWHVQGGNSTRVGTEFWYRCPAGYTLLGHLSEPNGFWICMASG